MFADSYEMKEVEDGFFYEVAGKVIFLPPKAGSSPVTVARQLRNSWRCTVCISDPQR